MKLCIFSYASYLRCICTFCTANFISVCCWNAQKLVRMEILNVFFAVCWKYILINFNFIIIMIVCQRYVSQRQQRLVKWLVLCAAVLLFFFLNLILIPRWLLLIRCRHVHEILFYSINFQYTVWDLMEPVIDHLVIGSFLHWQ